MLTVGPDLQSDSGQAIVLAGKPVPGLLDYGPAPFINPVRAVKDDADADAADATAYGSFSEFVRVLSNSAP